MTRKSKKTCVSVELDGWRPATPPSHIRTTLCGSCLFPSESFAREQRSSMRILTTATRDLATINQLTRALFIQLCFPLISIFILFCYFFLSGKKKLHFLFIQFLYFIYLINCITLIMLHNIAPHGIKVNLYQGIFVTRSRLIRHKYSLSIHAYILPPMTYFMGLFANVEIIPGNVLECFWTVNFTRKKKEQKTVSLFLHNFLLEFYKSFHEVRELIIRVSSSSSSYTYFLDYYN